LSAVNKAGVEEETIVFFTSDNGPWLIKGEFGGSAGLLRDGRTTTWEGGVREPGIVRWKGKIEPGRVTNEVAATYDIFATAAVLAGANVPTDRAIDGKDLSGVLFDESAKTPHECIFHYKGTPDLKCPITHNASCPGLWAARCGSYKLHYVTSNYSNPVQGSNNGQFHDPPLIFHIEHDPSEKYPLPPGSHEYEAAFANIDNAVNAHKQGLVPGKMAPPEMAKGSDPALRICCKSNTTFDGKYPDCTCNPENWNPDLVACSPDNDDDQSRAKDFDATNAATWPVEPPVGDQVA